MKIAAGCFGCLALVFLLLTLLTGTLVGTISTMLVEADPGLAVTFASFSAYIQYLNGTCCCLSGALCIILFAVGMSRGGGGETFE
ncbi:MAG: hypothetical protein FJ090_00855 [Deltaproteobacteria bacterium]|nr:hypothetical protein [Deltaproteobacteria bacterium]